MILKYDKQRSLCDEIIQRQQKLIEGWNKILSKLGISIELKHAKILVRKSFQVFQN
jgi:hypothetical protein